MDVKPGDPLDATIRLATPFNPTGSWTLAQSVYEVGDHGYLELVSNNVFVVPETGE
jgi:hypothetical protein